MGDRKQSSPLGGYNRKDRAPRLGHTALLSAPVFMKRGLAAAALTMAATLSGMQDRFAASAADFVTRQDNWRAGLRARDTDALPTLFGMGLGTYQRAMLMRSAVNRPSDASIANVTSRAPR